MVSTKQRIHKMLEIVQKYTSFATHAPSLPVPKLDTIVLTGSTGSLGIEILALLAKSPEIVKVYALNRKSSVSVRQRHENAIRDRGLDLSVLDSEKIQLVEIDLDKDHFGLASSLYDEVCCAKSHTPRDCTHFQIRCAFPPLILFTTVCCIDLTISLLLKALQLGLSISISPWIPLSLISESCGIW